MKDENKIFPETGDKVMVVCEGDVIYGELLHRPGQPGESWVLKNKYGRNMIIGDFTYIEFNPND